MEWLSTFIIKTVEFLEVISDNIGKYMWKFYLICVFLVFIVMVFISQSYDHTKQKNEINKHELAHKKSTTENIINWLREHTPKN